MVAEDILADDCKSPCPALEVQIKVGLSVVVDVTSPVAVLYEGFDCCGFTSGP